MHPEAARALDRLTASAGTDMWIGVASGRRIADLRRLLPPLHFWIGLHGLELAIGDAPFRLRYDPVLSDRAMARLRDGLEAVVRYGGRIEDKQHSIAVHVRGLDPVDARAALAAFEEAIENERRSGAPIESMRGHQVVEARPTAAGKHRAIAEVLGTLQTGALGFVGDDVTDEEVFCAYPAALTVVVMDPPRQTAARFHLRSPAETAAMLDAIVVELTGPH
jgi:trehalose-phosphatase